MIAHISGWAPSAEEYYPPLKRIIDLVKDEGVGIASNWVPAAEAQYERSVSDSEIDWHDAIERNESALKLADVYIAEVSNYRLYHGYEMARALAMGKPVLLLSKKSFRQFAIYGIENALLHKEEYESAEDLQGIVVAFLNSYKMDASKSKVTVKVSQKLYAYLKERSDRTQKTDEELLRDLAEDGLKYRQLVASLNK